MLSSKNGATITEMTGSTGWQDHSVRGFLSGIIKKKFGHSWEVNSSRANAATESQLKVCHEAHRHENPTNYKPRERARRAKAREANRQMADRYSLSTPEILLKKAPAGESVELKIARFCDLTRAQLLWLPSL